jgi:hypothetical protein
MSYLTKLTNVARAKIIDGLYGTTLTAPTYIGWGIGTTQAEHTDTTLESASAEARTNGTKSKVTTTVTADTYRVVGSIFCTGAGKTITEAGLFDASSAGNMYIRGNFSPVVLLVGDSILFTFSFQQT